VIGDHPQRDYRGLRVLVMGLGSFGGGLGVVRHLIEQGAQVTITDTRPAEKLQESIKELQKFPELTFRLGGHSDADFQQSDLIVVNPAVRPDNPYLQMARSAGVPLTSEMNLFWQWNPAPVVAVTGSNGKSTTTALIASILRATGRTTWLGGNIGVSLLPQVHQIRSSDVVVLELSSFQLTDLDRLQVSPAVSVVTNFAPNHLDWHPSLDHYRWAKQTILRWQSAADVAILNSDDADVRDWDSAGRKLTFGLEEVAQDREGIFADGQGNAVVRWRDRHENLPLSEWLRLPGRHNLSNALAATCAGLILGADRESIRRGIENYTPLPHRLQRVGEVGGRQFYNDSLATTPESTIVALEAFQAPILLMAGGYDKHVDLSQMASSILARAKGVALMGQTAPILRSLIGGGTGTGGESQCQVSPELTSFRQAFDWVWEHSTPGDVILLSPGCASYDWFRNFADRGDQFMQMVSELLNDPKSSCT
jgi:UDP-N-acetylmuramoylalanine--D-glutamate ligase